MGERDDSGMTRRILLCANKSIELSSAGDGESYVGASFEMSIRHLSRNIEGIAGYARLESGERSELEIEKGLWYSYIQRAGRRGRTSSEG